MLFPQGTQAEMVLPNGTTQPITNLTVRATEYTVGPNGPKAMPGLLPSGVEYTYAVELSVDESLAAGAKQVRFNQPVVKYLENFLGFATGARVPSYYYDRERGIWVSSEEGRVIKILSVSGGMAALDTNGDDLVDDAARLRHWESQMRSGSSWRVFILSASLSGGWRSAISPLWI